MLSKKAVDESCRVEGVESSIGQRQGKYRGKRVAGEGRDKAAVLVYCGDKGVKDPYASS